MQYAYVHFHTQPATAQHESPCHRQIPPCADGTYRIFGSDGEQEFSSSDPWPCASPSHDNPPGSLSLTADSAGFLQATWTAPDADLAGFVFGYQVRLAGPRWPALEGRGSPPSQEAALCEGGRARPSPTLNLTAML